MKTALILSAIDPSLGGVLVTGSKGSGKTTIIRAMEDLLPTTEYVVGCEFNCDPGDAFNLCTTCLEKRAVEGSLPVGRRRMRIVELPLSATEDGLLGAIDAEAAFRSGVKRLQPGLLGRANQNILYVEDVNLLPDHLVDCILDPAISGRNVVQREGLSLEHPSRFTLIASMNPEEGELRPQILDRFALKVEMNRIMDPEQRAEIARRNLSFEEDPEAFCGEFEAEQEILRRKINGARGALEGVGVPEEVMRRVAVACSKLGVEGLRSDIAIVKATRALASLEEKGAVDQDDVFRVLDLAVAHRLKRKAGEPQARASIEERVREALIEEIPMKGVESAEPSQPYAPLTDPPRVFRVKRRKLLKPMNNIVFTLVISGLIVFFSLIATFTTLYLRAIVFRLPPEALIQGLTLREFLLHLLVTTLTLGVMSLLSRRVRRPVLYIYRYIGSGLKMQIMQQQVRSGPPEEGTAASAIKDISVINVPLFASFRGLYKALIEKGAKLLDVRREERRRYKFPLKTVADRRLRSSIGKASKTKARADRGRYVSYEFPKRRPWDVALGPTFRAAAPYQRSRERGELALRVEVGDIRVKVREMQAPLTVVLLLDMSESIVPSLVNVRNAIMSMRDVAFKRRDRVGLVVFKGEGASTLQSPTTNLGLVVKRVMEIGASDFTPLASGMYEGWRVLRNEKTKNRDSIPVLVIVSDGIANIPLEAPLSARTRSLFLNTAQADVIDVAQLLGREGVTTMIINPSHLPLGRAASSSYKGRALQTVVKRWFKPTELLMEIPRITGGYYYGIGEGGDLEQVFLTEAFSVLGRGIA